MTEYEIWEKILDSGDLEEIEELLRKVFTNEKIIQLFLDKFKKARQEVLEEELRAKMLDVEVIMKNSQM